MPSWAKLLIPLSLGIVAGGINLFVVTSGETFSYLVAREPISAGEVVTSQKLGTQSFPVTVSAAIAGDDVAAVIGRKASRFFQIGDLFLRQDLLADQSLDLGPKQVAVNVSLEGVQYETALLRVGSPIGFVVPRQSNGLSASEGDFEVLGPYTIVAVGSTTASAQKGGGQASTISVAVAFSKENRRLETAGDRLIRAKLNKEIAAVVLFRPDDSSVVKTL